MGDGGPEGGMEGRWIKGEGGMAIARISERGGEFIFSP